MQNPRFAHVTAFRVSVIALPLVLGFACSKNDPGGSGGTTANGGAGRASGGSSTSGVSSSGGNGTGGASKAGGAAGSNNGGSSTGGTNAGGSGNSGGIGGSGEWSGGGGAGGSAGGGNAGGSGGSSSGGRTGGVGGNSTVGGAGMGGSAAGGASGSGGTGGTGGTGGSTANGGTTGSGGTPSGMCASAFFSADAASRKSSEYTGWKTSFVQECSANGSAVVKNGGGVYSEGIGYGMLLAANNDDQPLFDKLWKFYGDHVDKNGLMNWSMDACAAPGDNTANAASDGDLDAALGLVVANKNWGGYISKAQALIGKIKQFETDSCSNGLNVLRPGDVWGGCSDPSNKGKVNPSYFSPGHYRVFATVDTANADFWIKLAADSYTLLAQYQAAMNGLVPEWGYNDGRIEGASYDYNACRTPWRVAMDFMWFCTPEAKTFLGKIGTFVDGKGGVTSTGYAKNSAFVGAFADAGIAISQAKIDSYENAWVTATGMDDTPYFQGTLRRLYLLVAGGQFRSGL